MKGGTDLFFEESDNRSSESVVYRLRVLEASLDRVVIETENVSPVRAFLVTLFPPGSLRTAYFLERRVPGAWDFCGLSSITEEASARWRRSRSRPTSTAQLRYIAISSVLPGTGIRRSRRSH